MVRWCWLIWLIIEQGPTTLAVGASVIVLDIFSVVFYFSLLSPSRRKTA